MALDKIYMIRLLNQRVYFTFKTPANKQQYIAFKDRNIAQSCKSFIIKYKGKFGEWPDMDMRKKVHEVRRTNKPKYANEIVDIEEMNFVDFKNTLDYSNMDALFCQGFDVVDGNILNINIKGYEIKAEYDQTKYLDLLENLLNDDVM